MALFKVDEEDTKFSWFADDGDDDEIDDDQNLYMADSEKAGELISELLRPAKANDKKILSQIQTRIKDVFHLYSDIELENELDYYRQFRMIYGRLTERRKLEKISRKTVIGIGGKFSSGKSKFLNAVAGLNDLLPEATVPTTSIPTYIISGETSYVANNIYDGASQLTKEKLQAITHEFYEKYRIGFSSFVESIIISSSDWILPENLALLDTPGYNKYDNKVSGKTKVDISDRMKAYEQLKNADFLIWLASVDNGTLTQDDIHFIDSLHLSAPILVVFNKCDQKPDDEVKQVLQQAVSDVQEAGLNCYGIAGYSALDKKEVGGELLCGDGKYTGHIIQDFLQHASQNRQFSNDIYAQLCHLEKDFRAVTKERENILEGTTKELEHFIQSSKSVMNIQSLSKIWSIQKREKYELCRVNEERDRIFSELNQLVTRYLRGENA